jgi:CRP-like cAMP-binding protein
MPHQALNPLVRRLKTITSLSEDEKNAILALPARVADLHADADIVREGDRPSQCCLLVEGFLCRYKTVVDGKRQILAFYVPGDIPDLLSLHIDVMDHSLATLVPSKVAFIPHDALRRVIDQHSRIAGAFWRDTLIDAALFREWIVNVGSRDAYTRIGHLICEVFEKLKAVGLTDGNSFDFPITQTEIGDATGLSTVHVNRSIMALRADGLIILGKGRCTIPDLTRLQDAATFDPAYLHLTRERRGGNGAVARDQNEPAVA